MASADQARAEYIGRINRVMDYICTHLTEPLDLDTLAAVAHFSPFHFHRIFSAATGETLADYVRRRRLELGAGRLLAHTREPVLNIALDVGFTSAELFSRNFRQHFGISPSAWRSGGWRDWAVQRRDELSKIHHEDRKNRQAVEAALRDNAYRGTSRESYLGECNMEVTVQALPERRVAYLRYIGPYGTSGVPATWEKLNRWCLAQGFGNPRHNMIGIAHNNPKITAADKCRYDACVEIDHDIHPSGEIGVQTIPGGRYACARFQGSTADIGPAWQWIFAEWLPASGYECDDRPCFELYPSDVNWSPEPGIYVCDICIPVKPAI